MRLDLPQGTLDLLILRTLALEPQHGWALSNRIRQLSSEAVLIQQGTLYPALQPPGAQGHDPQPLGTVRQQPARQILRTDKEGIQAA